MSLNRVQSALLIIGCFAAGSAFANAQAEKKPLMEMHGYIHLKLTTAPALWDFTPTYNSYWNTMGREGTTMGWVRLAPTFNLENGARLVTEIESDGKFFNEGSDNVFDFRQGSAYLEMPISTDSKVWFGRRRFEINQQRWSDGKPFNPSSDRLNGGGFETKVNNIQLSTTLAIANNDANVTYQTDPTNKTKTSTINLKKIIFIQQATTAIGSNASLAPLLIVDYVGKNSQLDAQRDAIEAATGSTKADSEADQRTNVQAAVGYTSWGEGWWNNVFAGVATQNARPGTLTTSQNVGRADKDIVTKIGTQGGYNALRSSANIGLYYGGRVDLLSYKNDMQQLKIDGSNIVNDGSSKTKQGYIVAVNVQPIYYFTEKLHGALDLTYTERALVADGSGAPGPFIAGRPSSLAVSPILKLANKAEPISLPQVYVSATYTQFAAKNDWIKNGKGEAIQNMTTVQAGLEADF